MTRRFGGQFKWTWKSCWIHFFLLLGTTFDCLLHIPYKFVWLLYALLLAGVRSAGQVIKYCLINSKPNLSRAVKKDWLMPVAYCWKGITPPSICQSSVCLRLLRLSSNKFCITFIPSRHISWYVATLEIFIWKQG